jgi:dihydroneopterin aldolase
MNIKIIFHRLPKACMTGQLEDTICYAALVQGIKAFCSDKAFNLLEHLGYELYQWIKQSVKGADIELQIKKNPPIEGLEQSIFHLSDRG